MEYGAKHNADPPEILCESCLQPKLSTFHLLITSAPSRPSPSHVDPLTTTTTVTLASALLHHPSPFVCAARQHEAAEIGAHPPFMYV
jgi:hypothetical protein